VLDDGRFVEVGGERIHLIERGSGPPLLLVHGFPSTAAAWSAIVPRLEAERSTVALDMVGFGQSTRRPRRPLTGDAYADRLVALLDALGLERVDVTGLSWGGSVVQRLAARHPERVRRMVLLAPVSAAHVLPLRTSNLLGLAVAIRFPAVARRVVRHFLARTSVDPDLPVETLVRAYVEPLQRPGTLAAMRRFVRDTAATEPIDLTTITAPTLVVVPQADRIVPPARQEEIAALIPAARYEPIPGVGHAIQFEAPDRVAELMRDFLA
jgi:4,5:9,10-diseco-3-hydroxy-5,9,17-trioxoandrosta-1(10),2-diene-4-oate hydrolase